MFIKDLNINYLSKLVLIKGFVTNVRNMKTKIFIDVRDVSLQTIQCIIEEKINIYAGEAIELEGIVHNYLNKSLQESFEIKVTKILFLYKSPQLEKIFFDNEKTKLEFRLEYIKVNLYKNLKLKSDFFNFVTKFLSERYFINIDTPILTTDSSDTGANIFKVVGRNKIYFLPQSPQIFKQTLVCSGVIRYFQIAHCFRDEDLRLDRQFEFLQLDIEAAFEDREFIKSLIQELILTFFLDYKFNWYTITFQESIEKYGLDSPIIYKDIYLKQYILYNKTYFYWEGEYSEIFAINNIDIIFENNKWLTNIININDAGIKLKEYLNSIPREYLSCVWVQDFPLLEQQSDGSIIPTHNPFSKPLNQFLSKQFDLVLEGFEVLGGSERIDDIVIQKQFSQNLKIDLPMFKYAVPRHVGCAIGIERLLTSIYKTTSIRDWIAFPKTTDGDCLTFRDKINTNNTK